MSSSTRSYRASGGWVLGAAAALSACSPAPRWIAVDDPATRSVVLFGSQLQTSDTVYPPAAPGSADRITDMVAGSDGASLYLARLSVRGTTVTRTARTTGSHLALQMLADDSVTGMWLSPDARQLVVAGVVSDSSGLSQGMLHAFPANLADQGLAVPVCFGAVAGLTWLGRRSRAYVGCTTDSVVELDLELGVRVRAAAIESTTPSACGAMAVASSPNGTIVYVLCAKAGTLLYLDRLTLTPLVAVDVGAGASGLALLPGGGQAIVTCPATGEVALVDLRRQAIRWRVAVPAASRTVVGLDGRSAYVTSARRESQAGRLVRLDLEHGGIVAERTLSEGSSLLALWPASGTPQMRWTSRPPLQPTQPRRRE